MGELAGNEISLPPAGAKADHADLAAGVRLRAQEVDGTCHIAEHLLVRDAAAFADLGDDLLIAAVADAEIEARRHRGVAVMSEFAGDLAGPFVPTRHVVDHDDAGMRAGVGWVRVIRVAAVAAMPAIGRHPRLYVAKRHGWTLPRYQGRLYRRLGPAKASRMSAARLDIFGPAPTLRERAELGESG